MDQAFQALLDEWKGVKGNVIPLLQKTQDIFGYLPQDAMREIARATGGVLMNAVDPGIECAPGAIAIDSRTLSPGDLFVAVRGDRDGHDYVRAAADRGAIAALVRADVPVDEVVGRIVGRAIGIGDDTIVCPQSLQTINILLNNGFTFRYYNLTNCLFVIRRYRRDSTNAGGLRRNDGRRKGCAHRTSHRHPEHGDQYSYEKELGHAIL